MSGRRRWGRMVFLAALLGLLGVLHAVAANSLAVIVAGRFLTRQSPARRYAALTTGIPSAS
ncbi:MULTISPECIES: hypothetical protein [unclassified Paracoccus (in: a-proteobacteria)]|uniref:hypothetical protein n=1 Tax=unclassified Paracoccus (in: a-proteobacteria) TaxID=2688777 RepID=UPI001601ED71|nr:MULTISPECIES: hypothetical protein [unclassified Paracoccus (in: a-proteobacteria)]MBB1493322.1 hypothetical protein [Paracoccus sp. MC1854]MBB1499765.1 hypothetical protein [Paracoccus sp. MC1862]QQO45319.1 hypothetical protein JGR78_02845 [Paracoccus sp. MC1862]